MLAAPWYLLAAGIFVVILGYFLANLRSRSNRGFIDPKMSDEEIARQMNESEGPTVAGIVMLIGYLAIFASIVWRVVRLFV